MIRSTRKAMLVTVAAALSLNALASPLAAQVPIWQLADVEIAVDGGSTPLYRVAAAKLLSDGRVVVADAGNHRVAIFDQSGRLTSSLGREGAGPGDFSMLFDVFAVGDSIYAVDVGNARLTAWSGEGRAFTTRPIPPFGATLATVIGVGLDGRMLIHSVESAPRSAAELFTTETDIAWYSESGIGPRLFRTLHRYLYFFPQDVGYTTYRTPFLGAAGFAFNGSDLIQLPLHGDHLQIRNAETGEVRRRVDLPVQRQPFDRREIAAVRDSLMEVSGFNSPGAERIRSAFDGMSPPADAPVLRRILSTSDRIWVERFPVRGEATNRWWALDARSYQLVGQLELDPSSLLLDAIGDRVVLLQRDEWDIETVEVRRLLR